MYFLRSIADRRCVGTYKNWCYRQTLFIVDSIMVTITHALIILVVVQQSAVTAEILEEEFYEYQMNGANIRTLYTTLLSSENSFVKAAARPSTVCKLDRDYPENLHELANGVSYSPFQNQFLILLTKIHFCYKKLKVLPEKYTQVYAELTCFNETLTRAQSEYEGEFIDCSSWVRKKSVCIISRNFFVLV